MEGEDIRRVSVEHVSFQQKRSKHFILAEPISASFFGRGVICGIRSRGGGTVMLKVWRRLAHRTARDAPRAALNTGATVA
jgi:hypothetical protein